MTITFVTSDPARVPEPLLSVQLCAGLTGCDSMLTEYVVPFGACGANAKLPFEEIVRELLTLLPATYCSTRFEPVSPDTVPPTVKVDADNAKSESQAVKRQLAATQINATVFRAVSIAAKSRRIRCV